MGARSEGGEVYPPVLLEKPTPPNDHQVGFGYRPADAIHVAPKNRFGWDGELLAAGGDNQAELGKKAVKCGGDTLEDELVPCVSETVVAANENASTGPALHTRDYRPLLESGAAGEAEADTQARCDIARPRCAAVDPVFGREKGPRWCRTPFAYRRRGLTAWARPGAGSRTPGYHREGIPGLRDAGAAPRRGEFRDLSGDHDG